MALVILADEQIAALDERYKGQKLGGLLVAERVGRVVGYHPFTPGEAHHTYAANHKLAMLDRAAMESADCYDCNGPLAHERHDPKVCIYYRVLHECTEADIDRELEPVAVELVAAGIEAVVIEGESFVT